MSSALGSVRLLLTKKHPGVLSHTYVGCRRNERSFRILQPPAGASPPLQASVQSHPMYYRGGPKTEPCGKLHDMRSLTRDIAWMVERRKPNWLPSRSGSFLYKWLTRQAAIISSNSLPTSSSSTMGRSADGEYAGLPFLTGPRTTRPDFHKVGNWPHSRHAVKSPFSQGSSSFRARAITLPWIPSGPGATFLARSRIMAAPIGVVDLTQARISSLQTSWPP